MYMASVSTLFRAAAELDIPVNGSLDENENFTIQDSFNFYFGKYRFTIFHTCTCRLCQLRNLRRDVSVRPRVWQTVLLSRGLENQDQF